MSTLCSMSSAQIVSVVGIALVVVGTWLVAYEVVNRFLGYSHRVIDVRFDGSGVVEKTDDFKKWEMKRAFWMWAGLALITVGSAFQIYGTIFSGPATLQSCETMPNKCIQPTYLPPLRYGKSAADARP